MGIELVYKINELEKRVRLLENRLDTGLPLDPKDIEDFIPFEGNGVSKMFIAMGKGLLCKDGPDITVSLTEEQKILSIFTEDQAELIKKAAEEDLVSVRDFVIGLCIEHANNILNKKD